MALVLTPDGSSSGSPARLRQRHAEDGALSAVLHSRRRPFGQRLEPETLVERASGQIVREHEELTWRRHNVSKA